MKRSIAMISSGLFVGMLAFGVVCQSNSATAAPASTNTQAADPTTAPVDLHNTVCPVSGEKVGNSKLTETYEGKTYHFCCDDCPKAFNKNPDKFAKAVAADPAKYGVK